MNLAKIAQYLQLLKKLQRGKSVYVRMFADGSGSLRSNEGDTFFTFERPSELHDYIVARSTECPHCGNLVFKC